MRIEKGQTVHANADKQGNMVIQDKDRRATHVIVDGKTYNVRTGK